MRLILGSASPRRRELLAQIGVVPDAILPPDIDEEPVPREVPRTYCVRMAREKAQAVLAAPQDLVLCADTTVALGRRILGKPRDAAEAAEFVVRDTGPGPKNSLESAIFEPFVTSKAEGVGLGLAVAREVVEAHHGSIDWWRADKMTSFRVVIPVIQKGAARV